MTHRTSQIVTMVLAVAAAAAVGGVAYKVMRGSQLPAPTAGAGKPGGPSLPDVLVGQPASQPDWSNLGGLLAAGGGEFEVVDADPGGLAAPPLARRVRTVRQSSPAGLAEVGVYLFNGGADVIESFYAQRLAAAGWKNLGRARSGALRFVRAGQACTVQVGQPAGREGELNVEFHVVVQQVPPSP